MLSFQPNQKYIVHAPRISEESQIPTFVLSAPVCRECFRFEQKSGGIRGKNRLATNCSIAKYSKQDRKNYFIPTFQKLIKFPSTTFPYAGTDILTLRWKEGQKGLGLQGYILRKMRESLYMIRMKRER